ncbi:MAG TPA: transglutaminase domain-containing protein [Fimbriimonadaceae bacterium]|nr:transglutaminase domain-containing protein [Fimbriimonadaceae bacterium]
MRRSPLNRFLLLAPCALALPAQAEPNAAPRVLRTHFSYKATVPSLPDGAKTLNVWLPIPSDGPYQKVSNLKVESAGPHRITTEPKFGNRMVYFNAQAKAPFEATVSFDVERSEIDLRNGGGLKASSSELQAHLQPDAKVPIGGVMAQIAANVLKEEKSGLEKARTIYEHTVETMQYDYNKESPKLGEGDVPFVCDFKKGNCSDLHSYVISLARSEGVPAYLEYGFALTGIPVPEPVPAKGTIGGYHCWTWFYDAEKGWLPLDASDGRRWLDSKRPDVKEKLVGSLVLERSAVAVSRGRDLTLAPAQKAGPLNYFVYPYAEADGTPVEAKWTLNYELLSAASSVQEQLDELRRLVQAQAKEIEALKAANGGGGKAPAAQGGVATSTNERVTLYGFLRTDLNHDSMHMNPNNQFPFFVQSPSSTNVQGNNDQFTMTPRLTRLGLDFVAPTPGADWNVTGKVEFDFQGGGSESRPTPRGRHLYIQLNRGPNRLLIGQTWDLISPLIPSPNDDSLMWNAGNLGDRRPQVRYTHQASGGYPMTFAVALGLTSAVDLKDLDANGVRDGEDSGMPHLQARIGVSGAQGGAGIWGHIAKERTTIPVGGETNFQSNSLGADFMWRLSPGFDIRGEVWTGRNLSDFRGGIGQGVNTTTGNEIDSKGGWGELGFQASRTHRIALGYTVDDPDDDDVPASGRTKNDAIFLHNRWTLGSIEVGLNFLHWTTRYKGLSTGKDNRVNLYVSHKF